MLLPNHRRILISPPIQASLLVCSEVSDTQLRLSWTRGNGAFVLIVARLTSSSVVIPVGGTAYTANSVFGSGDDIGGGNFVVYKGTGSTVLITGLTDTTSYTFRAYEFNVQISTSGTEKYNWDTDTDNPIEQTTLEPQVAPTTQATNLIFEGDRNAYVTAGNGTHRLWLYNTGGTINASFLPQDNTTYVAGQVLGGGNTVGWVGVVVQGTITGLPYATSVAHKVFEYNIASGNPKYNTNNATGNPLTQDTINEPINYLYHHPIAQSDRHLFNIQLTGRIASKAYCGSFFETSTEYGILLIGDNLSGPTVDYNYDQGFLRIKSKSDGLPFQEGWDWYKDIDDYPIPVLVRNYLEPASNTQNITSVTDNGGIARIRFTSSNAFTTIGAMVRIAGTTSYNGDHIISAFSNTGGQFWIECTGLNFVSNQTGTAVIVELSIQNWPATFTVFADDNMVGFYSYNSGNIATRYSVGRMTTLDGARTITRIPTNINSFGGGQDRYQFQQSLWHAGLNKWIIFCPNARTGSQNRWTSLQVWTSNDGQTGLNFTRVATDILEGTDIDVNGFGLFGGLWLEDGRIYWKYTAIPLLAMRTTPATDLNAYTYPYGATGYSTLQKQVVTCSIEENITSTSRARIEKIDWETDRQACTAIFPGSAVISHGGANHVLVNRFLYKPEDNSQISIDVCVMSDVAYTGHGAQTVGRNVYPGYLLRFFKMHQCHLDDTYLSTTTQGIEVITETALTLGGSGSNPAQFNMNGVILTPGNKYPQGASFTHSQTRLGMKMVVNTLTATDSISRGICEKEGTFKFFFFQGNKAELWLYGVGGGIKKYRMTNNMSSYRNELWVPVAAMRIGWTAILNEAGTDIDIKINADYAMNVALTVIQAATFTQIVQNSNPITFGHTTTETDCNKFFGSCKIFSGDECTQQNWLEENDL